MTAATVGFGPDDRMILGGCEVGVCENHGQTLPVDLDVAAVVELLDGVGAVEGSG